MSILPALQKGYEQPRTRCDQRLTEHFAPIECSVVEVEAGLACSIPETQIKDSLGRRAHKYSHTTVY
jgi:hypothetical protein